MFKIIHNKIGCMECIKILIFNIFEFEIYRLSNRISFTFAIYFQLDKYRKIDQEIIK